MTFELKAWRRKKKGRRAWAATVEEAHERAMVMIQRWPTFYGATAEEALQKLRAWCTPVPTSPDEIVRETFTP